MKSYESLYLCHSQIIHSPKSLRWTIISRKVLHIHLDCESHRKVSQTLLQCLKGRILQQLSKLQLDSTRAIPPPVLPFTGTLFELRLNTSQEELTPMSGVMSHGGTCADEEITWQEAASTGAPWCNSVAFKVPVISMPGVVFIKMVRSPQEGSQSPLSNTPRVISTILSGRSLDPAFVPLFRSKFIIIKSPPLLAWEAHSMAIVYG